MAKRAGPRRTRRPRSPDRPSRHSGPDPAARRPAVGCRQRCGATGAGGSACAADADECAGECAGNDPWRIAGCWSAGRSCSGSQCARSGAGPIRSRSAIPADSCHHGAAVYAGRCPDSATTTTGGQPCPRARASRSPVPAECRRGRAGGRDAAGWRKAVQHPRICTACGAKGDAPHRHRSPCCHPLQPIQD